MELLESRKIILDGEEFELRLYGGDGTYKVISYHGSCQVSPSYSVDFITNLDYFMQHRHSLTERLFDIAQSDLERGIYLRA